MRPLLEIAVQDPDGVAIAERAGADRIELCSGLALGGLTPSAGLIETAQAGRLPVHVLIRPRAGGFDYSSAERAVILADVERALAAGVAGVVVGATTGEKIDLGLIARVRELADPAEVTFHRAFDTLADPRAGLEALIGLGVDRVLTAGGCTRAEDGLAQLRRVVGWAAGRVQVMAGGGIDPESIAGIAAAGVAAVHASAKRSVADPVPFALGSLAAAGTPVREATDESAIRALLAALDRAEATR